MTMKKIFYSLMVLALFTACSNEDMMPGTANEGPVQLSSVSVGAMTRGSIIDDNFAFDNGDKVVMTATVNGLLVNNTFTYNGSKWSQDASEGSYSLICIQDDPEIESIVSYGGNATAPSDGGRNQNIRESYIAADVLKADASMGNIEFAAGVATVRLDHSNSDFALKVYDGYDENNTLAEETPVLKIIVDVDGLNPGSVNETYTAWNAGKHTDTNGNYTLFRVHLRSGCSILKAELSKVNEKAGDLKTDILFRSNGGNDTPSNEINLEQGRRYNASYTYDMINTVATVSVSILPFEGNPDQNITVAPDITNP